MTDELSNALANCLPALEAGEPLDTVLARYPALAGALRPLLQAARAADRDLTVPRRAQMASRARFLAQAGELHAAAAVQPRRRPAFFPRALSTALTFVLGFVAGTYGVVAASAQSLPGDQLYGIKRAAEDAQILLAPTQAQPQLQEQFAEERVREVEAVTARGRAAPVEFEGQIQSLAGGRWVVSGITVIVSAGTRIEGAPAVGALVQVKGESQADGTVVAYTLEIENPHVTATPVPPAATPRPASATPLPEPSGTTEVRRATHTPEPADEPEVSETPEPQDDHGGGDSSDTPEPDDSDESDSSDDHSGPSPRNTPEP